MQEISNRLALSLDTPITRFGFFAEAELVETTQIVYAGFNIRTCLYNNGIDPNLWRDILEFNQVGSVMDLIQNVTVLEIPRELTDRKFAVNADA